MEEVEDPDEVNDNEEEDEPTDDEGDEEEETVVNPLSSLPSGSSSAQKFPHLRKDLMVLHELKRLIEVHKADTSRLFKPFMIQLKATYRNARLSVRKRMMDTKDGSDASEEEIPITFISDVDTTLVIFDYEY